MNYAIFRSEPIYTLNDLAQIGSHNKREKKAYQSNPDIDLSKTKDNVELVPLNMKYVKGFYEITKDYKKEHEERMKTERDDRKRTFRQMVDKSKSVVADELVFTATHTFFNDMSKEEIKNWADRCMEFVHFGLGYEDNQILHATLHMDEKTPHIHCVVVPLVKKLDKRTNTERYTISKKQFIHDKEHLSELQDEYCEYLNMCGFALERGTKHSDREHINIKEFKKLTKSLTNELDLKDDKLSKSIDELEEKMKSNKTIMFDKESVKVKKETFDSMNKVIDESKKVREIQPKLQTIFNEVENYANSYKSLEKQNKKYVKEVNILEKENKELRQENNSLIYRLNYLFELLRKFLRKLLQRGNDYTKNETSEFIKECYDEEQFNMNDVVGISRGTTKQDKLFEYVKAPDYLKSRVKNYDEVKGCDNSFEIG